MPIIKKYISLLCLVLVCLGCNTSTWAESDESLAQMADFDVDLNTINTFEETNQTRAYGDLSVADQATYNVFNLLAGSIDPITRIFTPGVISAPLWYNTKAPSGRDVLYLLPYKISALERGGFAFNMFFNMTDNMNVGASNLFNASAITDRAVLAVMFNQLTQNNLSEADITSLLALFQKITLQERRVGSVIQAGFAKGPFTIQLNTSIHLAERNFWLNPADQATIASLVDGGQDTGFDKSELVRYRAGMGDTRIKLGLNTLNKPKFQIDVGLESIIPTSRFSYTGRYQTPTSQSINFESGFLNTLFGVRDYLIDPRMGNGGHFGFGCYFESKASLFHNLASMWTRVSYDKLLPGEETRLMLSKQIISPQDIAKALHNVEIAVGGPNSSAAMETVRTEATKFTNQYLFPTAYQTKVCPGDIFNGVFALSTDIKKMRFSLGYDFYMKQAENINGLINTEITLDQLVVSGAQASLAYQHKIFTEALYINKFKRCDIGLGLGGDYTVASKGIGMDWTTYAKFTASF